MDWNGGDNNYNYKMVVLLFLVLMSSIVVIAQEDAGVTEVVGPQNMECVKDCSLICQKNRAVTIDLGACLAKDNKYIQDYAECIRKC